MIERRRRFFRGDSLLDMPIFPQFVPIPVQFARLIQSATGIIVLSQVAIATSGGTEQLMRYKIVLSVVDPSTITLFESAVPRKAIQ
jgi:hypothetical protein